MSQATNLYFVQEHFIYLKYLHINTFHTCTFKLVSTFVQATNQQSLQYGCVVEKEATNEVTHYVEKPETYVSSLINCGVYAMSLKVLKFMEEQVEQHGFDVEFAK